MQQFSKQMQLHADYSKRVMETGNHFKNGASPKSQMSKGNNFIRFICIFILFFVAHSSTYAQKNEKLEAWLRNKGVELFANCAHPLGIYERGEFIVYDNYIWIKVYYDDDDTTESRIYGDGSFLTTIKNVKDTDWISPFLALWSIKNIVFDIIKNDKEDTSSFEKKINKTIEKMSGEDLTCLAMSVSWLQYKNK
jgi:hypothetical protein